MKKERDHGKNWNHGKTNGSKCIWYLFCKMLSSKVAMSSEFDEGVISVSPLTAKAYHIIACRHNETDYHCTESPHYLHKITLRQEGEYIIERLFFHVNVSHT
jgi:hypothetical protein